MTRDKIEDKIKEIVGEGTTNKTSVKIQVGIWLKEEMVSDADIKKILDDLESYSSFHSLGEGVQS